MDNAVKILVTAGMCVSQRWHSLNIKSEKNHHRYNSYNLVKCHMMRFVYKKFANFVLNLTEMIVPWSFITALHWMQGGLSHERNVGLSVCEARGLWKKNERNICQNFIFCERFFHLFFWQEEWLVGGDLFYLKFLVKLTPLERKRPFSVDIRS